VLSRVDAPFGRPGHRLVDRHAGELAAIAQRYPKQRGMGLLRHVVERRRAPPWVVDNLASLEAIERKMYNAHVLRENLTLALTPVPRIPVPNAAELLGSPPKPKKKRKKAR
jgi:hypothetical protein